MTWGMLRRRVGPVGYIALIMISSIAGALIVTRPPSPLAAAQRLFEAVAFHFFGQLQPPNPKVIVIAITERTLGAFPYRSPIDRAFLAGVIDALAQKGVAAIGLDVVLDRPTEPVKDDELHRALTRSDVPVVTISVAPDTTMPAEGRRFLEAFLTGVRKGDANLTRDHFDDMIRDHVPRHPTTGLPSFPAAIAEALGIPVPDQRFPIEWQRNSRGLRAGPDIPVYPAESVALLPPGWLKGKVALIGSLIDGSDEHRTLASAFGPPSFGVEIHAQVVSQLLNRRAKPAASMLSLELLVTVGLACAGVLTGFFLVGYVAVVAIVALCILFVAAVVAAYGSTGVLVPIVPPLVALTVAGGAMRAWRGGADRRDRQALRALFSRFVSEPVVNEIMRERDLFMAGGRPVPRQLTATILFADVAGFTTICEVLQPAPLISWLDRYIDTMAALIMAHDGVLLRFIGDGILAVFGVPIPRADEASITTDAKNAARCAVAMERAMERLNDAWCAEGLPEAGLRIGIHTGQMVAGSLGNGPRMEFCLLGDTANVGSRLEQLGKQYAEPTHRSCTIVVGEPTWSRLGGSFPGIAIGDVMLRGRHTSMTAYRIDAAAVRSASAAAGDTVIDPPVKDSPVPVGRK